MALRNAIAPLGVTVKDGSFHELVEEAAAATTGPAVEGAEANKRKRGGEDPNDAGAAKKAKTKKAVTGGANEEAHDDVEDADGAHSSV